MRNAISKMVRASGVGRRASGVGRRASGIGHRASGVGHRASGIGHKVAPRRFVRWVGLSTLISICAVLPLSIGGLGTSPAFAASGDVSTYAGSGAYGSVDGPAATAQFAKPVGVAVDGSGNVFIADWGSNSIRKIDSAGVVTTLGGRVSYSRPAGMAVDEFGNVYVADSLYSRIIKIDSAGAESAIGSGIRGFADGPSMDAKFDTPRGVAVDRLGNVYVADTVNGRIRKIDPLGVVSTLAGNGGFGYADGPGSTAQFKLPAGVAVDGAGVVFVADSENGRIRKIDSMSTCQRRR